MPLQLRPYQAEAVEAIFEKLATHRSTLTVLPTGTGKSPCFSEVARRFRDEGRGRALLLAHRDELIHQAQRHLERAGLSTSIEMAEERAAGGLFASDAVVGSVQTLSRPRRREAFSPEDFGLIVVDEAHHAVSETYRQVLNYFGSAKVLGVTATPDRADGLSLRPVFESVAYVYEIRDAIEQGYLVPIRQQSVAVQGLDLSKVRVTAGDLNEAELEQVLVEEENLHGIAHPTVELAGDRPTMVFAATVAHAHKLAAVMQRRVGDDQVVVLDGTMDRSYRAEQVANFAAGKFQFLVNCALFLEGFDSPRISCVAMARPTKSRALWAQAIGRGTRLYAGKKDLLVLDFQGNAGKHALVSTLDVLDGKTDAAVRDKAGELMAADPELDALSALDGAAHAIAEERRRAVLAEARYVTVDVDPFEVLGIHAAAGRWAGMPPTPKQVAFLAAKGIDAAVLGYDKGQASVAIDALLGRQRDGLCTFKQARTLLRAGLNPDVSFERARRAIDSLASHGWRAPEWLRAELGTPAVAVGRAA